MRKCIKCEDEKLVYDLEDAATLSTRESVNTDNHLSLRKRSTELSIGDTETNTTADSIIEATTELVFSTTLSFGDETPTFPLETTTQTESLEPTTFLTETDENHGHALFFKVPSPFQNSKNSPKIGSRIKFEDETMNNDQPEIQDSTNVNDGNSRVIFKDEYSSDLGDLMTSENVRHSSHRIRFPDERGQPLYLDNNGKDSGSFHQFRRPQRQNQKPNSLQINQRHSQVNSELANDRLQSNSKFMFNHWNRDKNFWQAPSSWRESSPKKALVLRLPRMPGQGNFTLSDIGRHRSEPLFRQVRIEDLSYIFGHRRKRSSR